MIMTGIIITIAVIAIIVVSYFLFRKKKTTTTSGGMGTGTAVEPDGENSDGGYNPTPDPVEPIEDEEDDTPSSGGPILGPPKPPRNS